MRTIRRSAEFEQVIHRLAEARHPKTHQPLFSTYRDLAVFAALVGYEMDTEIPLADESKDLVDGRVFEKDDTAFDILCLIALASTQDVEVLRPENEDAAVQVFERHVNGGLRVLSSWLRETPEDPDGDKALINALHKYKFLNGRDVPPADALDDVNF